jgi:hypothetical protein
MHADIIYICKTKKTYHMECPDIDERIISKWISSKVDQVWMGTEFI